MEKKDKIEKKEEMKKMGYCILTGFLLVLVLAQSVYIVKTKPGQQIELELERQVKSLEKQVARLTSRDAQWEELYNESQENLSRAEAQIETLTILLEQATGETVLVTDEWQIIEVLESRMATGELEDMLYVSRSMHAPEEFLVKLADWCLENRDNRKSEVSRIAHNLILNQNSTNDVFSRLLKLDMEEILIAIADIENPDEELLLMLADKCLECQDESLAEMIAVKILEKENITNNVLKKLQQSKFTSVYKLADVMIGLREAMEDVK